LIEGILIILIAGYIFGKIAGRLKLPELIGMLLAGILIGPYFLGIIPEEILLISEEIRLLVLLIILFKAGLGLDREKLKQEGTVAIRLGFIPAVIETAVITLAARYLLGWDWITAGILGWIICAASPAVIVPMMLKLKASGIGTDKGIPDLILAGGTLSDAVAVTMFGIFLTLALGDAPTNNIFLQLANIPLQIVLGLLLGYLVGRLVKYLIRQRDLSSSTISDLIIALSFALLLLLGEAYLPYSEFLAVMTYGFTLLELDAALARKIRAEVDKIWTVGKIFLFVLIGAAVNLTVMLESGPIGLLIIALGLVFGRTLGIHLSALGSSLNLQERNFMVVGQTAKATVQAAIGGIPLAAGLPQGEIILALSVLSIVTTAPLGAAAIKFLAPRWLESGEIDPTKITVQEEYHFLVALDGSYLSREALREAARLARQVDARLIILNIQSPRKPGLTEKDIQAELEIARDIEHEIIIKEAQDPARAIIATALSHQVDYIFMGKNGKSNKRSAADHPPESTAAFIGDVSSQVSSTAEIPVILK